MRKTKGYKFDRYFLNIEEDILYDENKTPLLIVEKNKNSISILKCLITNSPNPVSKKNLLSSIGHENVNLHALGDNGKAAMNDIHKAISELRKLFRLTSSQKKQVIVKEDDGYSINFQIELPSENYNANLEADEEDLCSNNQNVAPPVSNVALEPFSSANTEKETKTDTLSPTKESLNENVELNVNDIKEVNSAPQILVGEASKKNNEDESQVISDDNKNQSNNLKEDKVKITSDSNDQNQTAQISDITDKAPENPNSGDFDIGLEKLLKKAGKYGDKIASLIFVIFLLLLVYLFFWTEEKSALYSAQLAKFIGSSLHLILIIIALFYFRKHFDSKKFRPIDDDIENDKLKDVITNSTGYKQPKDWIKARGIALNVFNQYNRNWQLLLMIWLVLYLVLSIISLIDLMSPFFNETTQPQFVYYFSPVATLIITSLNNLNTLFIMLCFYTLNTPITTENKNQSSIGLQISREHEDGKLLLDSIAAIIFWFVVEGLIVGILLLNKHENIENLQKFSMGLSGVCGGLAMALYVGRFQSKFLKSPDWLLITLYLYTVIQAFFIYFGDSSILAKKVGAIIIIVALVLKYLLIRYNFWLFDTGRLLFYLVRVRRANNQVDEEWKNFSEVLKKK